MLFCAIWLNVFLCPPLRVYTLLVIKAGDLGYNFSDAFKSLLEYAFKWGCIISLLCICVPFMQFTYSQSQVLLNWNCRDIKTLTLLIQTLTKIRKSVIITWISMQSFYWNMLCTYQLAFIAQPEVSLQDRLICRIFLGNCIFLAKGRHLPDINNSLLQLFLLLLVSSFAYSSHTVFTAVAQVSLISPVIGN